MKITALEFYKNGYMQESFAFGGSLPKEKIDPQRTYPSSLQNYLVDTGHELILVDTGFPVETKDFSNKPGQMLYFGEKVNDFVAALKKVGYQPGDINKVVITHKHPDHSGEIRLFSHSQIFISQIEAEAMNLQGEHIVKVNFEDRPYKNFDTSKTIAEGVTMLPAYGHTHGNAIVIVEDAGLYYMLHGDVTYTDEALRRNELSVVFENIEKARASLYAVRKFILENDTIYLSTHTPEGLTNLENKRVMKL